MKTEKGFTLIEIMIAIIILATLTVFTAQSLSSALRNSAKYRKQIENTAELRDVVRVMESDINLAFHHRNIQKEILDEIKKENKKEGEADPLASPAIQYTQFMGESDSLHFTTLNNARTYADSPVSDQAEVGYYLRNCTHRADSKKSSSCLWRRHSTVLDEDVDKGGSEIVILENVKEFSLRYIGEATEEEKDPEWKNRWLSNNETDGTADKFPKAVEITLTVNRLKANKEFPQTTSTVAALRFPNNKRPKKEEPETEENAEGGDAEAN